MLYKEKLLLATQIALEPECYSVHVHACTRACVLNVCASITNYADDGGGGDGDDDDDDHDDDDGDDDDE